MIATMKCTEWKLWVLAWCFFLSPLYGNASEKKTALSLFFFPFWNNKNIQASTISAHSDLSLHGSRGQASFIAMSLHLTFKPNYASAETASCPHLISLSHSYIVCSHKLPTLDYCVCFSLYGIPWKEFFNRSRQNKRAAVMEWEKAFFLGCLTLSRLVRIAESESENCATKKGSMEKKECRARAMHHFNDVLMQQKYL